MAPARGRPEKSSLMRRLIRLFRPPLFGKILADSLRRIRQKPVQVDCPKCGSRYLFADHCPVCAHPRQSSVDRHV